MNPAPVTCESCNAAIPVPEHGTGIGGGWAFLCGPCAARVCACGAVVLPVSGCYTDRETDTETAYHFAHQCTRFYWTDAGRTATRKHSEPIARRERGECTCDGCQAARAFPQYAARRFAQ